MSSLEDIANENEADCAISKSEVRWLIDGLERAKPVLDAAIKLSDEIKTVHLDMGGKHRYALGHKTHQLVTNLKSAVREYKKE